MGEIVELDEDVLVAVDVVVVENVDVDENVDVVADVVVVENVDVDVGENVDVDAPVICFRESACAASPIPGAETVPSYFPRHCVRIVQNFPNDLNDVASHPWNQVKGELRMDAVTQRWVEKAGLRFEADGLPRTAGRILAYLILSPGTRSLDELAADLQISKASASSNTSLLERLGAVERETRAGDRHDFFRLAENLHVRILDHWLTGVRETREVLGAALDRAELQDDAVKERVQTLWVFFDHMLEEIEGAGERWVRDHERTGAGADELASKP